MTPTAPGRLTPQALAEALGIHTPTQEQARVIAHRLSPLLVVAGAGSGKTATMAQRVVYLVATGQVRPDQILGLTFTRKATAELDQRVASRLAGLSAAGLLPATGPEHDRGVGGTADAADVGEPMIATYNSFAGALVRDHGLRIGVDPTPPSSPRPAPGRSSPPCSRRARSRCPTRASATTRAPPWSWPTP